MNKGTIDNDSGIAVILILISFKHIGITKKFNSYRKYKLRQLVHNCELVDTLNNTTLTKSK